MLLSALSFSFMGVMVKNLSHLPTFEAVFFRNLISFIIALMITVHNKIPILNDRKNLKLLLSRSLLGLVGVVMYFYAIQNMPLADSAILNRMSPFFCTDICIYTITRKNNQVSGVDSYISIYRHCVCNKTRDEFQYSAGTYRIWFCYNSRSCLYIGEDVIRQRTPIHCSAVFQRNILNRYSAIVYYILSTTPINRCSLYDITGVFAAGGQYALTYSYKYAKASEVSIYSYAAVIFSAIIAFFLWGEKLSWSSIVGIAIVLVASYINYRIIMKKK